MPQQKMHSQQTPAEKHLVDKLLEDNARLKTSLTEARQTITSLRSELDKSNQSSYRLSRLKRLFDVLKIPTPTTEEDYISTDFLENVKRAVGEGGDAGRLARERDVALEAIRLLIGASKVSVPSKAEKQEVENLVEISMKNDELDREMVFTIDWDDKKIEYNRISMRVDKESAPPFAHEECIVFDFPQGPLFLAEVLKAVHEVRVDSGEQEEDVS